MKSRIPPVRKVNKSMMNAAIQVANDEIKHAAYRVYVLSCIALRQMGFGEKRMAEYVKTLEDLLNQYGTGKDGEVADTRMFQLAERTGGIPIDNDVKSQMLEIENTRFFDSLKRG